LREQELKLIQILESESKKLSQEIILYDPEVIKQTENDEKSVQEESKSNESKKSKHSDEEYIIDNLLNFRTPEEKIAVKKEDPNNEESKIEGNSNDLQASQINRTSNLNTSMVAPDTKEEENKQKDLLLKSAPSDEIEECESDDCESNEEKIQNAIDTPNVTNEEPEVTNERPLTKKQMKKRLKKLKQKLSSIKESENEDEEKEESEEEEFVSCEDPEEKDTEKGIHLAVSETDMSHTVNSLSNPKDTKEVLETDLQDLAKSEEVNKTSNNLASNSTS